MCLPMHDICIHERGLPERKVNWSRLAIADATAGVALADVLAIARVAAVVSPATAGAPARVVAMTRAETMRVDLKFFR